MTSAQMAVNQTPSARHAMAYLSQKLTVQSLTKRWPTAIKVYVQAHGASFFLYAIFGKGYAYVGVPPLFIGEVLLTAALFAGARSGRLGHIIKTPIGITLVAFMLWQCTQTVPYVPTYGILTVRDAMTWIYSLFGVAIAALIVRLPNSIEYVTIRYRAFGNWFPVCGFLSLLMGVSFPSYVPLLPGAETPILNVRPDELCVQLAGVTAFMMTGAFQAPLWWIIPVSLGFFLGGSISRGGSLAFILAFLVISLLRRRFKLLAVSTISFVVVGAMLSFATPGIERQAGTRARSVGQVIDNLSSIGSDDVDQDLDNTKTWRLNWWSKIRDYTVYGEYFWTGKGYGINLALDDGIITVQSDGVASLRSPHNSHLTFLARSGVPGILLWLALQLSWLSTMLRRYIRAERRGDKRLAGIFSWLIAYWTAFLVSAAFDVALEGPMTAIPFWTVFGLGWGAAVLADQDARSGPLTARIGLSQYSKLSRLAKPHRPHLLPG
jgi:O-antigen ligase